MLRVSPRARPWITAMKLASTVLVLVLVEFTALTSGQSLCDPKTQYERSGYCCMMCPPGTSMSRHSTCLDPQCTDCGENEYQDGYNMENMCQRQPYCDPNKNFQSPAHVSKKKESSCVCVPGFHCSSASCLTCVPHATCGAGFEARPRGNQTHDTVCRQCPEGSFSNVTSWKSVCVKWTACTSDFQIQRPGTDTADVVCEPIHRQHLAVIAVGVAALVAACLCVLAFFVYRGSKRNGKLARSYDGVPQEPPGKVDLLSVITPSDKAAAAAAAAEGAAEQEEASGHGHSFVSAEDDAPRTPEENEDERPSWAPAGGVSDNGNFVKQETGKAESRPEQESQSPSTLTSSLA